MQFRLALAQIAIEGGEKSWNLKRAVQAISAAASGGAQVVLLPEALPFGWTHSAAKRQADPLPEGESFGVLSDAARNNQVFVCAGLIEKAGEHLYNAAVFIGLTGELILHHRKIYELDIAHHLYSLGEKLNVAATPLGCFGLMICADAFAPGQVLSRSLALMGADIILSPCAWAVPATHDNTREPYGKLWLENYCPVAREYQIWIAGCSNVGWITDGPWKGRKCVGNSLVVDANGEPVLWGPYGEKAEEIIYVDVVLRKRPAQGTGWEKTWNGPDLLKRKQLRSD